MLTIILIHVQRGRAHGNRPRIFPFFSLMLSHKKRATDESRTRDLFLTKEALYHWATAAFFFRTLSFWVPFFSKRGLGSLLFPAFERKTGLEPATYSLEGYRSTKWATSASLSFGISWGRVDSNHRTLPRTDLQSVAIAAMRLPRYCCPTGSVFWASVSSRWRDSNPRQADYKSATLPTELHRLLSTFQTTLFLVDWGCKNTTFFKYDKSFFHFFWNIFDNSL